MSKDTSVAHQNVRLTGFLAITLPKISLAVGIVFLVLGLFVSRNNLHHFSYSYLTSFIFYLVCSLGALFFVIIQHLTRAGWSVLLRRIAEVLMSNLWVLAIMFIPVLFALPHLYHWTLAEAAHDHILKGKSGYLNIPFFLIRATVFFGAWLLIARKFFNGSLDQDKSGDHSITLSLQKAATWAVAVFAITQTFAYVDWVMSLTPHWYSTVFGVYFFAVSAVASLSMISLILMILRRFGFLKDLVNVEHFHDLGKFMYGFNIFWTYIAFSQYFLIWYSNIPEETAFFHQHFNGSWNTAAIFLVIGHFVIPFITFMSRHARRNLPFHCGMVIWMLIMTYFDIFWVIMPNVLPAGFHLGFSDIASFLGLGGIFVWAFFTKLKSVNLIPVQDPRLHESINFHNT
jgi:hypothetical protein